MDPKNTEVSRGDRDVLVEMNRLRKRLNALMVPEVLDKLVALQEELGADNEGTLLERYEWFKYHSEFKDDCVYTTTAKRLFLYDHGDNVINLIKWLYENFARDL